jgi:voltage-gated potassium channel Kch
MIEGMADLSQLGVSRFRDVRVHDRFGTLLALLVAAFLLNGFTEQRWARVALAGIQVALLVVVYFSTRIDGQTRNRVILPFLLLVGVTFVSLVLYAGEGKQTISGALSIVSVMVYGLILYLVVKRVMAERGVDIETILGALCIYFLLGLMFSTVFHALDVFSSTPIFGDPIARPDYSYFSFVTLTTLGYGDISPVSDLARRVAVIEAMCGQVFLATVIARMVSLYGAKDLAEQIERAEQSEKAEQTEPEST